ncbi:MAG: hypothetical protein F6J98_28085 [Moorea sp. SIO4G2]|nr:hypothetical protein [Moorena sp. SIO4G2]
MQSASGGNHGSRSWGEPPQVVAASPRPRCIAAVPGSGRKSGKPYP